MVMERLIKVFVTNMKQLMKATIMVLQPLLNASLNEGVMSDLDALTVFHVMDDHLFITRQSWKVISTRPPYKHQSPSFCGISE